MTKAKIDRDSKLILFALLIFTLFFRLATLMMIHTGVDERDYWYSAKALSHGLPYPEISHRTTRYAVILPTALAQLVLGSAPNVYYVMPILNNIIQVGLAFLIGIRLKGKLTGFIAGLSLAIFPYMIRAGSQVRPEIFSVTYILLALLCFIEYLERDDDDLPPLLWTAATLFVAYEAKITNLFFVPGFALAILIEKKRLSHALLLCGILLGLFLAETGLYAVFTSYKLGELDIIMKNHFHPDSMTLSGPLGLLGRYSSRNLQAYWRIPFALFALSAVYYLARGKDKRVRSLIIASLSFFLFITLEVKSLNPITPAESFINRYFSAVLGPVFIVLGYAVEELLTKASPRAVASLGRWPKRAACGVLALGAAGVLVLFSLPNLPKGVREYANSPARLDSHPLSLNVAYRDEINRAWAEGTPIVASAGLAGQNAMYTCLDFFIDLDNYRDGKPPAYAEARSGDTPYILLSRSGGIDRAKVCLEALRTPFRVIPIAAADIETRCAPEPETADEE